MPIPREVTETIHQRITRLRIEHDWSQAELARRMDVSTGTVQNWEAGRAIPETKNTPRLSRELGVSVQYLITGSNLEEEPDTVRAATLRPIIESLRAEVTRLEDLVAKHLESPQKPANGESVRKAPVAGISKADKAAKKSLHVPKKRQV